MVLVFAVDNYDNEPFERVNDEPKCAVHVQHTTVVPHQFICVGHNDADVLQCLTACVLWRRQEFREIPQGLVSLSFLELVQVHDHLLHVMVLTTEVNGVSVCWQVCAGRGVQAGVCRQVCAEYLGEQLVNQRADVSLVVGPLLLVNLVGSRVWVVEPVSNLPVRRLTAGTVKHLDNRPDCFGGKLYAPFSLGPWTTRWSQLFPLCQNFTHVIRTGATTQSVPAIRSKDKSHDVCSISFSLEGPRIEKHFFYHFLAIDCLFVCLVHRQIVGLGPLLKQLHTDRFAHQESAALLVHRQRIPVRRLGTKYAVRQNLFWF